MEKRILSGLTLALAVLLAACASAPRASQVEPAVGFEAPSPLSNFAGGESFAPAEEAVSREADSSFKGQGEAADRLVIRNAYLSVVVPDPAESVKQISQLASQMGGFVVSSNVFENTFPDSGVTAFQASITIRVPAERMDEALESIKTGATEVRTENVTGEDVTQEFTDLQSRLRNLEAAEEQLFEIMNEATDTEDVLAVFNQLTQVRSEIELIQGRIQYLSESARLSAISVDLIPDVAAQPLEIGGWRPRGTINEAFTALIQALRFLGNAAIWTAICVVPIGLIFGVPGYFAFRAIRRRRKAGKAKPTRSES